MLKNKGLAEVDILTDASEFRQARTQAQKKETPPKGQNFLASSRLKVPPLKYAQHLFMFVYKCQRIFDLLSHSLHLRH